MSEELKDGLVVSDDVIAVTAAMTAARVRGVASLQGGITDSFTKNILKMKNVTQGVKISREEDSLVIDIFLNVYYGYRIPEVAWEIQETIRREVKNLTGEEAGAVNIHVQGVVFDEDALAQAEGDEKNETE